MDDVAPSLQLQIHNHLHLDRDQAFWAPAPCRWHVGCGWNETIQVDCRRCRWLMTMKCWSFTWIMPQIQFMDITQFNLALISSDPPVGDLAEIHNIYDQNRNDVSASLHFNPQVFLTRSQNDLLISIPQKTKNRFISVQNCRPTWSAIIRVNLFRLRNLRTIKGTCWYH